ncbi:MAG: HlyD family efflux transporter periplasmic adaptor subunit [Lentisphaeria bacterium]|nr:HlyD family efflux transporter periplasmic adaptor subunit [Lentisphaeria bacterium]
MNDSEQKTRDPEIERSGQSSPPDSDHRQTVPLWFVWVIRLTVAGVIAWGGYGVYAWMMAHKPKRERRARGERIVTVQTLTLQRTSKRVVISTTGTVVPARELLLKPRVGGEVVEVHPDLEPGGRLRAGTVVVRIDPTDYRLALLRAESAAATARNSRKTEEIQLRTAQSELLRMQAQFAQTETQVAQAEAQLAQAKTKVVSADYEHAIELGQQDVAKHQWTMMGNKSQATELEQELTLRKPHLRKVLADVASAKAGVDAAQAFVGSARSQVESSKASVAVAKAMIEARTVALASADSVIKSAESNLEKAKLDLARTEVKVPFNAVVTARAISVGAQVGTQTVLGTLVDADRFWIEVALPLDRMSWVRIAADGVQGSKAIVRHSGAASGQGTWQGIVVRRLPQLEVDGRQVRLLVEIAEPLEPAEDSLPLFLDSFVTVELTGPEVKGVFVVPRVCVHGGDEVWLRNGEKRLEMRRIETFWSDAKSVMIRNGLKEGELLIVSDIASPVPGMKVALPGEIKKAEVSGKAGKPGGGKPDGKPGAR